jgi:hypothetical protein
MLRQGVWHELTDVPEVLSASHHKGVVTIDPSRIRVTEPDNLVSRTPFV